MDMEIDDSMKKAKMDDFKTAIHESWVWEAQAGTLKRAADCILEKHNAKRDSYLKKGVIREPEETQYDLSLINVYFMLMGLTIENLIKKIIINKNPGFEENLNMIKSHNMVKLLRDNNINDFKEFHDLMETLQVYVEWKGRYTIPVSFDKMIEKQVLFPYSRNDIQQQIEKLYQDLRKKLNQETKLQYIRDNTGRSLSYKEYLEIKNEIIAFIIPKEGEIKVGDISNALKSANEISEVLGYPLELIGTILWECLYEVDAISNQCSYPQS